MGQDFRDYWHTPLKEIRHVLNGSARRLARERDERMSLAWHIAALERQKKLPKLQDMITDRPRRRKQTPEEFEAAVRSWLAKSNRKR